jgi:hypothetical protein
MSFNNPSTHHNNRNYNTWFRRAILRRLIHKFIYYSQKLDIWLDKRGYESEGETQGYYVTAKKN